MEALNVVLFRLRPEVAGWIRTRARSFFNIFCFVAATSRPALAKI